MGSVVVAASQSLAPFQQAANTVCVGKKEKRMTTRRKMSTTVRATRIAGSGGTEAIAKNIDGPQQQHACIHKAAMV